jgi:hypothetical protein
MDEAIHYFRPYLLLRDRAIRILLAKENAPKAAPAITSRDAPLSKITDGVRWKESREAALLQ